MLVGNQISDVGPLVDMCVADANDRKQFAPFLQVYIYENPLGEKFKEQAAKLKEVASECTQNHPRSSRSNFKVGQMVRGRCGSQRIEDGNDIDPFLNHGTCNRRQQAEKSKEHPDDAQRHSTDGTFESDAAHAFPDVEKLIDLLERAIHDYRIGSFSSNLAPTSNRDSNGVLPSEPAHR